MTRSRVAIVLAFLALAAVPALAQEGRPPGPPPGAGPLHLDYALRGIELTEDQNTQIDALLDARRETAEATRPAFEAARRALAEQVRAATFDEAAIRVQAAALAVLDADHAVADAALLRDVRALLTPEQLATFEARLASPPPRGGMRNGPREGGPPDSGSPGAGSTGSRRQNLGTGEPPQASERRSR